MLTDSDGELLVRRARRAVAAFLDPAASPPGTGLEPAAFRARRGVFVTWRGFPDGNLRGCIGYPLPVLPLGDAVERAAVAASTDDPRFPPVHARELSSLVVEVSVLSTPRLVTAPRPERSVTPGRDGLIVETERTGGLLLPQVAVEQGWSAEEFLGATCEKAGLDPEAWKRPGVKVSTFEADVFAEERPGGPVARRSDSRAPPSTATDARSAPRTSGPRTPSS